MEAHRLGVSVGSKTLNSLDPRLKGRRPESLPCSLFPRSFPKVMASFSFVGLFFLPVGQGRDFIGKYYDLTPRNWRKCDPMQLGCHPGFPSI